VDIYRRFGGIYFLVLQDGSVGAKLLGFLELKVLESGDLIRKRFPINPTCHKICWIGAKVLQRAHRNYEEPALMYLCRASGQSTQFGHLSHLDSRYHSRS
jgi:hypothetical protein